MRRAHASERAAVRASYEREQMRYEEQMLRAAIQQQRQQEVSVEEKLQEQMALVSRRRLQDNPNAFDERLAQMNRSRHAGLTTAALLTTTPY